MVEETVKTKSNRVIKSDGNPKVDNFHNKDGLLIKTYAWTVSNPVGIIVLVHGLKSNVKLDYLRHNVEISPDYKKATLKDGDDFYVYKGSWVETLNKNNYSVYSLDLQGHGSSEGWKDLKAHVNKFDDLVYDVIQYINRIHDLICLSHKRELDTTLHDNITNTKIPPFFLFGLSMGGNIILRILEILGKSKDTTKKVNIKGCVVLAGMISLDSAQKKPSVKYFYLPFGKTFCALFPTMRFSPPVHSEMYPFVHDVFDYDKHVIKKPVTCRLLMECLNAIENLNNDVDFIPKDAHLLFVHSRHDKVCDYYGMLEFTKKLKIKNFEVMTLETNDHFVTMEPGNEQTLEKILAWLSNVIKHCDETGTNNQKENADDSAQNEHEKENKVEEKTN